MKRPNYRLLTVPLVGQRRNSDGEWLTLDKGDGKGPQPHGDMACWYAAACMVSYYFRPGPRLGLPDVWRKDQGMAQASISKLIRVEGLMALDPPKPFKTEVTTEWLEDALWRYGPIWAGGAFHMGHVACHRRDWSQGYSCLLQRPLGAGRKDHGNKNVPQRTGPPRQLLIGEGLTQDALLSTPFRAVGQ
ncbi:papain-like cysteine protease family protein [Burkholderia diffusa]|uniref:papain-like cysteine protease family protein n=1 Tax=Burkholderia diffusa TaxID=488732 RepID=UPI003CC82F0B